MDKEMKRDFAFYRKLFLSTFTISAVTIGGGYVIVPLIRKRFVEEYGWIDEDEMLNFVAIGQSSPGPIAVNTSILVGYHLAGFPGALMTMLGTVLPPFIMMAFISYFYTAFASSVYVRAVLLGMQAGVAAVILSAVIDMVIPIVKGKQALSLLLMLSAFAVSAFLQINVMYVILFCLVLGLCRSVWRSHTQRGAAK